MSTQAKQVGAVSADIQHYFNRGVGGITEEQCYLPDYARCKLADRVDNACFIVGPHQAYENGIGPDSRIQCLEVDATVGIHRQVRNFGTFLFEVSKRIEHGLMFGTAAD